MTIVAVGPIFCCYIFASLSFVQTGEAGGNTIGGLKSHMRNLTERFSRRMRLTVPNIGHLFHTSNLNNYLTLTDEEIDKNVDDILNISAAEKLGNFRLIIQELKGLAKDFKKERNEMKAKKLWQKRQDAGAPSQSISQKIYKLIGKDFLANFEPKLAALMKKGISKFKSEDAVENVKTKKELVKALWQGDDQMDDLVKAGQETSQEFTQIAYKMVQLGEMADSFEWNDEELVGLAFCRIGDYIYVLIHLLNEEIEKLMMKKSKVPAEKTNEHNGTSS